ncbi:hypothetical protein BDP27DRAFT_1328721 [Rhodocollybia butyracea]|uniref:F-box domain-containing protein n=1 Tax=Rhodocollybia butyracea TaxID=206335 RepID=A0A9P5U745_9AGAR|nr:hypothetical protein BDP27DRAFT_1328721 [Rhodocollybia butyracea]
MAQLETPADRVICFRCRHSITPRTNIDTAGLLQRFRLECGPDAVDEKEVAEMLIAIANDHEDYESKILLLQSRILYIQTQQARLQKHTVDVCFLLSPIRKVPNEILLRIFDYACETNLLPSSKTIEVIQPRSTVRFPWKSPYTCAYQVSCCSLSLADKSTISHCRRGQRRRELRLFSHSLHHGPLPDSHIFSAV